MRLQQYLARSGITSRRKAEDLIRAGRVSINDKVAEIGAVVGENDVVRMDGERVRLPLKTIVIALNKPKGYTATHEDNHAEKLVYELVPVSPGLHSIGRLDKDTEGLLLLTNDGQLTQLLSHPRNEVRKLYRVWSKRGRLNQAECNQLTEGLILSDGPAKALEAVPSKEGVLLTMAEGRKREVRRMLGRIGHPVEKLVRLAVGPIELGNLELGHWRYLEAGEIELLRQNAQPPKLQKAKPVQPAGKPFRKPHYPKARTVEREPPAKPAKPDLSETTKARIGRVIEELGGPDKVSKGPLRAYDQERTPNPKRANAERFVNKPAGKSTRHKDKGKPRAAKGSVSAQPSTEATGKPSFDREEPSKRPLIKSSTNQTSSKRSLAKEGSRGLKTSDSETPKKPHRSFDKSKPKNNKPTAGQRARGPKPPRSSRPNSETSTKASQSSQKPRGQGRKPKPTT